MLARSKKLALGWLGDKMLGSAWARKNFEFLSEARLGLGKLRFQAEPCSHRSHCSQPLPTPHRHPHIEEEEGPSHLPDIQAKGGGRPGPPPPTQAKGGRRPRPHPATQAKGSGYPCPPPATQAKKEAGTPRPLQPPRQKGGGCTVAWTKTPKL